MLDLGNLKPKKGSTHKKKRVGRGSSAGGGKTCGRGHKGQKSRTGGTKGPFFEGGQNPFYRRLPKKRGFKNYPFKVEYQIVNLEDLNRFKETVKIEDLVKEGLVDEGNLVKVLGDGELKNKLDVYANKFSKSAKEKIEGLGGKAVQC